jgi:hypothetical protein
MLPLPVFAIAQSVKILPVRLLRHHIWAMTVVCARRDKSAPTVINFSHRLVNNHGSAPPGSASLTSSPII